MKKLFVFVCLMVFVSVAPSFGANIPKWRNGESELFMPITERAKVKEALIVELMTGRDGMRIVSDSEYQLVVEKDIDYNSSGAGAFLIVINPYSMYEAPFSRIIYTFIPSGDGILLKCKAQVVILMGRGNAHVSEMSNKASLEILYEILENVRLTIEPTYISTTQIAREQAKLKKAFKDGYIPLGVVFDEGIVKTVQKELAGERLGLKAGDIVKEVNGKPVKDIPNLNEFINSRYTENKSVMLEYERDGKRELLTVKKIKID